MALILAGCTNENELKEKAAGLLVEPSGANFSNISRSGNTICGLIKGKTTIDTFAGFRPFMADQGMAELMDFKSKSDFAIDEFKALAIRKCSSEFSAMLQSDFSKTKIQNIRMEASQNAPNP
jgi:hypothetical protein